MQTIQAMLLQYFSDQGLRLIEKALLCGIFSTGFLLFCVLLTIFWRFLVKRKSFEKNLSSNSVESSSEKLNTPELSTSEKLGTEKSGSKAISKLIKPIRPIKSNALESNANYFGIPNPESDLYPESNFAADISHLKNEHTHSGDLDEDSKEDWETKAIRNFNQHFKFDQDRVVSQVSVGAADWVSVGSAADATDQISLGATVETSPKSEIFQQEKSQHEISQNVQNVVSLKLDLAKTYLEIDDTDNANQLLKEVLLFGNSAEKKLAEALLTH